MDVRDISTKGYKEFADTLRRASEENHPAAMWLQSLCGEAADYLETLLYIHDNAYLAYRDLGSVHDLTALVKALEEGRVVELPFVAMVEQSLQDGEMKPQRDQRFNGRYAVVYNVPKKWGSPLIDICGSPYNRDQAEARMAALTRTEAEAALSGGGEDGCIDTH